MNSWRTWVLTLSFFAAGCTCGTFDPRITRFACVTTDDCGAGFVCNGLECVPPRDGGVDAGRVDAGVDRDGDGVPLPADCDDGNAAIYPGSVEACSNGLDDDCDRTTDCEDPGCDGLACVGGGSCLMSVCRAQTEVSCTDGVDNDLDGQIDCADSDCPSGTRCDDQNLCTTGERCVADGGCEKLSDLVCNLPPGLCFTAAGTCTPDAGGCVYGPKLGGCDDGLACTLADSCAASGSCSGMPRSCPASTNVCLGAGTCQEPTGACRYAPLPSGACNDGQSCTLNDTCDGDGGCRGTPAVCTPPSQCHQTSSTCSPGGGCQFTVRAGTCDAGTGAGTCNSSFTCVPSQRFPYQPSNFTETELPTAGADFTVSCALVVDTTTPSVLGGTCASLPAFTVINGAAGAEPVVLFLVNNFTVSLGASLEVRGSRPAIFAVLGDVTIAGPVIVSNAAGTSAACGNGGTGFNGPSSGQGNGGGGGAGFGTAGGAGGTSNNEGSGAAGMSNGTPTLIPLRGGCNGGAGGGGISGGAGGLGGGALQISAVGLVTIDGLVTAFGHGGGGPIFSQNGGGGGGGSGGALLFEGQTVTLGSNAGGVANGGGGGEGGSLGSASAGSDGRQDAQPAAGGGMGTPGGGNGGSGGAAGAAPLTGLAASTSDRGGGGGGGAVGFIRINASTSCSRAVGSVISPPATSNGACP